MIDAILEIGEDNTLVPFEGDVPVVWQFDQRLAAAKMPNFKLHCRRYTRPMYLHDKER